MKSAEDTAAPDAFRSHRHKPGDGSAPSTAALRNERQRTNAVFSATAWDRIPDLEEEGRDLLRWFHLHALDRGLTNTQVGEILGYDRTNAYRILNGTYQAGSKWPEIVRSVAAYRVRTIEATAVPGIDKEPVYVQTSAARMFAQGVDYASRGGFVILAGPSGAGKTKTVVDWDARHPGRMVRFNAPVTGGHVALIRDLAHRVGIGALQKVSTASIMRSLLASLGSDQVVVVDQGSRLLPGANQIRATSLEVLMELNERTGAGIVIPLTWRSVETMRNMAYQIEQITGRAEIFRAPAPSLDDVAAIAVQYGRFAARSVAALHQLALKPGGLRTVAKVLSLADRMARATKSPRPDDSHVAAAIAKRFENMGGADPFDTTDSRPKTRRQH